MGFFPFFDSDLPSSDLSNHTFIADFSPLGIYVQPYIYLYLEEVKQMMADIPEGTWLAYQLTITESGKPKSEPMVEKYTFRKIDGDDFTVDVERNGEPVCTLNTKRSYGSGLFDFSTLTKKGADNIKTSFGHFYANIYEGAIDGKSVRMFLGKDDIVFRFIKTYNTESGLHSETRELCWASIKI